MPAAASLDAFPYDKAGLRPILVAPDGSGGARGVAGDVGRLRSVATLMGSLGLACDMLERVASGPCALGPVESSRVAAQARRALQVVVGLRVSAVAVCAPDGEVLRAALVTSGEAVPFALLGGVTVHAWEEELLLVAAGTEHLPTAVSAWRCATSGKVDGRRGAGRRPVHLDAGAAGALLRLAGQGHVVRIDGASAVGAGLETLRAAAWRASGKGAGLLVAHVEH